MSIRVLFKAPVSLSEILIQSQYLARICDQDFLQLCGKENVMQHISRQGCKVPIPHVCCNLNAAGYFVLEYNDPEIDPAILDELQQRIQSAATRDLKPENS